MARRDTFEALDEKGMPSNLEAERSALGAILLDNGIYYEAAAGLSVFDLTLDSHRQIYGAMIELAENQHPIDYITLSAELAGQKKLEAVGGVTYLSTLTDGLPRRDSIAHYIVMIREKAKLRRLIRNCEKAIANSIAHQAQSDEIAAELQKDVIELAATDGTGRGWKLAEIIRETQEKLDALRAVDPDREAVGMRTGIKELDAFTTGLHEGEVTVVAGFTGEGKTSYSIQAMLVNLFDKVPCHMFSLEMKKHDVLCRLVAAVTKISPLHLRDPRLMGMHELAELPGAWDLLKPLPFYIDDTAGLTLSEVISRGRLHARKNGCKLFVVDYLKLVEVPGATKNVERLSAVAKGLVNFAKTEKVHVIELSQVSVPEGKKKRRPTLLDLKESGDIANEAHNVCLFYRPTKDDGGYTTNDELIIDKQRAGPTGTIPVRYNKERLMWEYRKQEHRDE